MRSGIAPFASALAFAAASASAFALLLTHCGPKPPAPTTSPGAATDPQAPFSQSPGPDASAPIACTHDAKDLTPCAADCDRRIAFACTVLASRFEHGKGALSHAVMLHERACELGDAASCVSAARMHASGSGVPPSRPKQLELLAAACKLGGAAACVVSAKAYANGAGVTRDERRAKELWQLACTAGDATVCESLEPAP